MFSFRPLPSPEMSNFPHETKLSIPVNWAYKFSYLSTTTFRRVSRPCPKMGLTRSCWGLFPAARRYPSLILRAGAQSWPPGCRTLRTYRAIWNFASLSCGIAWASATEAAENSPEISAVAWERFPPPSGEVVRVWGLSALARGFNGLNWCVSMIFEPPSVEVISDTKRGGWVIAGGNSAGGVGVCTQCLSWSPNLKHKRHGGFDAKKTMHFIWGSEKGMFLNGDEGKGCTHISRKRGKRELRKS